MPRGFTLNSKSRLVASSIDLPELGLLSNFHEVQLEIARTMIGQRISGRPVEILEAGCGSRWDVDLEGLDYRVVGVDRDAAAVEVEWPPFRPDTRLTVRR